MKATRRSFIAASGIAAVGATAGAADPGPDPTTFSVQPIGKVTRIDKRPHIQIFAPYTDALLGLDQWSHAQVIWWFDRNDTPEKRRILQVHPRGNRKNPLTGVFACRAPVRPNLIALTLCKIVRVESPMIELAGIDAFDDTPVLDIKPYIHRNLPSDKFHVPDWL